MLSSRSIQRVFGATISGFLLAAALLLTNPNQHVAMAQGTTGNSQFSNCQTNPKGVLSATDIGLPTYGCGKDRSIIETVLQLVFGALAVFSLLFIVIGGLKYTLSGGDSNAIASAKNTILYAVVGLVLGVSVFTIIGFVFSQVG